MSRVMEAVNATCAAPVARCAAAPEPPERILLLTYFWHGLAERVPVLLHTLQYGCVLEPLGMRLVALVRASERQRCDAFCGSVKKGLCECAAAEHDLTRSHRHAARFANGKEHLLYLHADMWVNLPALAAEVRAHPRSTLIPFRGMQGTDYKPVSAKCHGPSSLNTSTEWWWHDDSRQRCAAALAAHGEAIGTDECCYGWADIAFAPKHTHAALRHAVMRSLCHVPRAVSNLLRVPTSTPPFFHLFLRS